MLRMLRSSRRHSAILPRSSSEAELRSMVPTPILPMERPGLFARLFNPR
ncbi:MAG TPA: hypothetical protein VLA45_17245 [Paracoccaceae bacterium]|nr:hypothetical protein [Paracoccaceae bacterium]